MALPLLSLAITVHSAVSAGVINVTSGDKRNESYFNCSVRLTIQMVMSEFPNVIFSFIQQFKLIHSFKNKVFHFTSLLDLPIKHIPK